VRPPATLAVLDELVGELVGVLLRVPLAHGTLDATAPAAPERLAQLGEGEQVRAGAADEVQRVERGLAGQASSPWIDAMASTRMAGSFFGARPACETSVTMRTVRRPSALMHAAADFTARVVWSLALA
jgi:hypothetical protein